MKKIYECETEIGRVEFDPEDSTYTQDPGSASIYAHTVVSLSGIKPEQLMRIEQNCYLRSGVNYPDQPWVQPDIKTQSATGSPEEMISFSALLHSQFVTRIKERIPERYCAP